MSDDKVYVCRICDGEFSEIPPESQQLTTSRSGRGHAVTYRFPNGKIHSLVLRKAVPSTDRSNHGL